MDFNDNKKIIQNIFHYYFSGAKNIKLPLKDIKAAEAILCCRTPAQGYNYLSCSDDHEARIQAHSCRHRSCPVCADKARHQWIESQKQRLLNCPHFHVIFTLPHEYLCLWQYNRKWFTKAFFKACRDTLIELLEDKKYLGATPGILMTLHTWGRRLNYHPHIHCLVTAGGVTKASQWQALNGDYLLPIRVVKALFRGKLQSYIKAGLIDADVSLPEKYNLNQMLGIHRQLYTKPWSVRIQEKYTHGKGVVLYLSRYMKGGPIKPEQIISYGDQVEFYYKDHRDQRKKTLSLEIGEFMRRLLWHVPEIGVHVVRHFGLYAAKNQNKRNRCREVIGGIIEAGASTGQGLRDTVNWCCKVCGKPLSRIFSTFRSDRYENSYIKSRYWNHVQQVVQANLANERRIRGPCPE